jgi:hypothetical protein
VLVSGPRRVITPSHGGRTPGGGVVPEVVSSTSPAAVGMSAARPVKFAATTREPIR